MNTDWLIWLGRPLKLGYKLYAGCGIAERITVYLN